MITVEQSKINKNSKTTIIVYRLNEDDTWKRHQNVDFKSIRHVQKKNEKQKCYIEYRLVQTITREKILDTSVKRGLEIYRLWCPKLKKKKTVMKTVIKTA